MKQELYRENYFLEPGYLYISKNPSTVSIVLGSCVAVCLWDSKLKYGGACHYLYPKADNKEKKAKYGDAAISALLKKMFSMSSKSKNLEAQIFGGASPLEKEQRKKICNMDNINIAKKVLKKNKVPLVSEDIGGHRGRKVIFKTDTGEIIVIKVKDVRQEDWYPQIV